MILPKTTYPSKRLSDPGGDFLVRQFIVPIQIGDTALWGWPDTGANVSIMPKELAEGHLGMEIDSQADGGYNLAGLIRVPYKTHEFNVGFYRHIGGTIKTLDQQEYVGQDEVEFTIEQVEFQIPIYTWEEIGESLGSSEDIMFLESPMPMVILGAKGVLENVQLTTFGNEFIILSPYESPYK